MNKSFLFFGLLLVLCANTAHAEEGLVAHYTFDENDVSTLYDYSGYDNNGTIYGAIRVAGINGTALDFDGTDDWVEIQASNTFNLDAFTVEAWFRGNDFHGRSTVVSKDTHYSNNAEWSLQINGLNKPEFQIYKPPMPAYSSQAIAPNETSVGVWHHIAGVYDGAIQSIYLDGSLATQVTYGGGTKKRNIPLQIGNGPDNYDEHFNGTIDELKIYNRALSAEEIKAEYEKFAEPLDTDNDGLDDELERSLELDPKSPDTDSDGIGDFEEYELLSTYAPIFHYTPNLYYTEFYPQPISIFLNHSDLYKSWLSEEATGPLSEEQIASYGQEYFMDFKEEGFYDLIRPRNIYKKAYDELLPNYGYLLYMRATTSEYDGTNYIVLQYWHHYLYNNFVNDHEGDWEMVEIILDKSTKAPLYATYSQHEDTIYRNGGEIKNWAAVQKEETHPRVYVAMGSHASYFEAGNFNLLKWIKNMADWTSSFGHTINFSDFNQTIILRDDANRTTQKWLSYGGRWGEVFIHTDTDMIGTNGPTGPAQKEEKWNQSAEWGLKYLTQIPELEYDVVRLKRGILTVIDDLNRKITFRNNEIIKEIPKAEVVSVIGRALYILPGMHKDGSVMSLSSNAQNAPAKYTYIIEANDTYEFEIYLANETEAMHIQFYNVSAELNTKDTVWIKGNKIYMNTTDNTKTLSVMLEYMTNFNEIRINLTNVCFDGTETLVIEILDWTKLNESGMVLLDTTKKFRFQNRFRTKIISKTNSITGILLKLFGPGDKELIHWNNKSGKVIMK